MKRLPLQQLWIALSLLISPAFCADVTSIVKSTYRFEGEGSTATCWLVNSESDVVLVTAAHVLERARGESARMVLRQFDADRSQYVPQSFEIRIREMKRPLWYRHSRLDIAVLPLILPDNLAVNAVPLETLATETEYKQIPPGQTIHAVGYPHAAQFKPPGPGFPLTRQGCVASFPPDEKIIVDFNTFEGDSGGCLVADLESGQKIIGLVEGQHLIDERFKTIYQEGLTRKRLGLAIVIGAPQIRATIAAAKR